ncbi:hypothetical protein EJ04DRAFT_476837 [Polyplosphaeria fusca]|uniref:Tyrosine specific protein phosphatases domain-containing protein n=1 Tax=Polyplosphaeria fusca TaxID=682080 RepID=A0A9P4QPM8_9PLEO|nr:hypothetical protein EJ04DRAFT_476837 [Polyplosphaeria fusca]
MPTSPPPNQPHLPSPPFHTIPNLSNLRDPALLLSTIRPNTLFRSADPSRLDRTGWIALRALGITHIFDLRSAPEITKASSSSSTSTSTDGDGDGDANANADVRPAWMEMMQAAGVSRTWVPVFEEADYSPERLAQRYLKYMSEDTEGFVMAYADILAHAGGAFREILVHLSRMADSGAAQGVLVHCTAGKDRTGVFLGVLFEFLGVERERIAEEYQLTEIGLRHVRDEVVGRLMAAEGFRGYLLGMMEGEVSAEEMEKLRMQSGEEGIPLHVWERGRLAALRMVGARRESMLGALEMVDRVYGGAEAYMRKECGLGDQELEGLRRNLVVGALLSGRL